MEKQRKPLLQINYVLNTYSNEHNKDWEFDELDYLYISVKKTGGYRELKSWKKINRFIEDYFEGKKKQKY